MNKRQRAKVRFVKCPKCGNILEEPEQCPLYACGGCETILQAKYYSGDHQITKSSSLKQSIVQSNIEGHASDDGESNSSSHRSSSPGEESTDQNGCMDKNEADESCKQEQQVGAPAPAHQYDALLSEESTFLHSQGNGLIENKTDLDRSNHEVNPNREHLEAVSFANEASSEGVSMSALENKDSVIEDSSTDGNQNLKLIGVAESATDVSAQNVSEVIENKEPLRYAQGRTVFKDTESQISVSKEATENEDDQDELSCEAAFDYQKQVREVGCSEEAAVLNDSMVSEDKERLESTSEKGYVHDESDGCSLGESRKEKLQGEDSRGNVLVDEIGYLELESLPEVSTLAMEDNKGKYQNELVECTRERHDSMNQSEASSSVEIARGVNDSTTEEVKSNLDDIPGPQHVESTNGQEILQTVNTHREVTNSLEVVPGSLTKDSLTYDGSISSFDGNDDQALEHHVNIPEDSLPGNGAVAGYVGAEESPEWSNDPSSRIYRSSRIRNQTKKSSQVLFNGKMKNAMLEEEESVGENVIPERNRSRRHRERIPARVPFYQSSEVVYETGSSSSYMHDELPPRMHHHPYRYEDPEPWVRNMYPQQGNIDRRSHDAYRRDNEFLSMHYSYDTSGEFYHRSRHHNHIDRRWRRESWHQNGTFPLMSHSADGPNGRYQMRSSYMHRHPDNDYWWSAQSPVSGVYNRQGLYASPSREVEWDPYHSSPPRFMEYENYPWPRNPISSLDDQRRKGQTMRRLYSKEKRQTVRRYFQPMAGGAPFVTCSFCFNVLQLPEHFLVSRSIKSGTHRLRCGDCSKILEFTLDNTSTLAPCKPTAKADSRTNPVRNTNSHDHINHSRGSSSVPEESRGSEKTKVNPKNSGGIEREQGSDNAADSSSQTKEMKVTWKLPNRKSPLHRLMGYSSLSVLLDEHQNKEAE